MKERVVFKKKKKKRREDFSHTKENKIKMKILNTQLIKKKNSKKKTCKISGFPEPQEP